MTRPRIAVVGLGGIAQAVHLPVIQRRRRDVDLVALAELSPSRLATIAERYGVPEAGRFAGVAELVDAVGAGRIQVDAAVLATAGSHVRDALAVVRAGERVLVEKPLAYGPAELDLLEAGLTALGVAPARWVRIGYMKNHAPAVAAARALLADVTPLEVRVEVLHPADAHQLAFAHLEPPASDVPAETVAPLARQLEEAIDAATGTADETARTLYANVVLGSIVHDLALTRHLGLPLAEVDHAARRGPGFPGSVVALGRTAQGVPWSLGWHFAADLPEYRETVTVHHERGTIELSFATPYVLNAPTALSHTSGDDSLRSTRTESAWPQEEAFERELTELVGLTPIALPDGCDLLAARRDLNSAQALWRACADTAGIMGDPSAESSGNIERNPS